MDEILPFQPLQGLKEIISGKNQGSGHSLWGRTGARGGVEGRKVWCQSGLVLNSASDTYWPYDTHDSL